MKVSVQIQCEDHNHERWTISSIFLKTRKHEGHQNYLIFKAYVCPIQTKVYIHIQTQRVHKIYALRHVAQKDKHVYLIVWTR